MENISIWERESFFKQDIIIVGGGVIGLFIAFQILRNEPKRKVLILERGIIPTGASLKNLGILCCADIPGIIDDMNAYGSDYIVEDAKQRLAGIKEYQKLFNPESIGFKQTGMYEFFYESELSFMDQIEDINNLLRPVFNDNVFENRTDKIKDLGMNPDIFKGASFNKFEASLDSGKLIRSLISKISALGYQILFLELYIGGLYLTGSKVLSHNKLKNDMIEVFVENPLKTYPLKFTCNKLVYSINGFAKIQFPDTPIIAGKGQIICTKPIKGLDTFKGSYSNDFYNFRVVDKRLMICVGNRIDFNKADVFELKNSQSVIQHIKRQMANSFPNLKYEIDLEWTGLMAFSNDPNKIYQGPLIQLEDNVILICRLCGNGVSIAPLLSKQIAALLQNKVIRKEEAKL